MTVPFHKHLAPRLAGIHEKMMASYKAGRTSSSATKGQERELFVQSFLKRSFPGIYRFGVGDITDVHEARSGQIDVVAEHPFFCSFPLEDGGPRLFLAESVAFVIEVKSNLPSQWSQVLKSSRQLKTLKRCSEREIVRRHIRTLRYMREQVENSEEEDIDPAFFRNLEKEELGKMNALPEGPGERIPYYVVAFKGWAGVKTFKRHFDSAILRDGTRLVDGVLLLDKLWFRGRDDRGLEFAQAGLNSLLYFLSYLENHMHNQHSHASMSRTYATGTTQARWHQKMGFLNSTQSTKETESKSTEEK